MELRVVLISLTNFIISKMSLIQKCCSITPKPKGIILDYNATISFTFLKKLGSLLNCFLFSQSPCPWNSMYFFSDSFSQNFSNYILSCLAVKPQGDTVIFLGVPVTFPLPDSLFWLIRTWSWVGLLVISSTFQYMKLPLRCVKNVLDLPLSQRLLMISLLPACCSASEPGHILPRFPPGLRSVDLPLPLPSFFFSPSPFKCPSLCLHPQVDGPFSYVPDPVPVTWPRSSLRPFFLLPRTSPSSHLPPRRDVQHPPPCSGSGTTS